MKKLLNPIEFYNDRKLLIANLIIFLVGTTSAVFLQTTFESPIDMHFSDKIELKLTILGNFISTLSLFLAFFLAGRIINKKTRVIDCLNLSMYFRIPYYILAFINISHFLSDEKTILNIEKNYVFSENQLIEMVLVYSMILFFIGFLIIQGIIIYRSFKTIANAKKTTDYLILVLTILAFIIISTLIIRNL